MPDIRLRPATPAPSDVALGPALDSRADITLRPGPGPDVTVAPNLIPRRVATAEAPPSSFTLAGAVTQGAATLSGALSVRARRMDMADADLADDEEAAALFFGLVLAR